MFSLEICYISQDSYLCRVFIRTELLYVSHQESYICKESILVSQESCKRLHRGWICLKNWDKWLMMNEEFLLETNAFLTSSSVSPIFFFLFPVCSLLRSKKSKPLFIQFSHISQNPCPCYLTTKLKKFFPSTWHQATTSITQNSCAKFPFQEQSKHRESFSGTFFSYSYCQKGTPAPSNSLVFKAPLYARNH